VIRRVTCARLSYQIGYSNSGVNGGVCGTARGVPDIAALADPDTGVAVYQGSNVCGGFGNEPNEPTCAPDNFYVVGGTSLACPMSAALIANIDAARVAAGKAPLGSNLNTLIYAAAALYHYRYWDITSGSSGIAANTGWDGATGLGVPLGPGSQRTLFRHRSYISITVPIYPRSASLSSPQQEE
jgi:kumamolisin